MASQRLFRCWRMARRPILREINMKGQTRAFAVTAEELEARRNPDELFVTRRKIFGGSLKPGVGKPLRAKPAGPTLVKYYPEVQVSPLDEWRKQKREFMRARGKGPPKKGAGNRHN